MLHSHRLRLVQTRQGNAADLEDELDDYIGSPPAYDNYLTVVDSFNDRQTSPKGARMTVYRPGGHRLRLEHSQTGAAP